MASVSKVETVAVTGTTASQSVALHDDNATYTSSASYETITMTSALTTGVATLDASAEADAKVVLTGSAGTGGDILIGSQSSNLGDTITGNAGNDSIRFATGSFTSADIVDGGDGTDTIQLTTNGSTVVDADFTNVTNVEQVTSTAGAQMTSLTLGALAQAAGITKVLLADTGALDTVTIGAGFTNAITVDFDADAAAGGNKVVATAYTGVLTVTAADDDLDSNASTITGGTGTSDELKITTTAALDVVLTSGMTAIEKVTLVGATGGISLTTADASIAAGKNLAIDLTASDDDANTVDASAETNGTVTITADASGAHIITLGQGNDSYTHTGTTGVSTVVGTKGNNIITTGGGADIITLGTGTDSVTSGAGNDIIKATGPTVSGSTTTAGNFTSADIINAGTGTDVLQITTDGFTLVDTDFAGLTSVETLTSTAGTTARMTSATLGANAMAAGITTVTMADTTASDKVVVSAAFTNALTVNLSADGAANTVDGSASAATVTIVAAADELDSTANVLKGGTGTGDTLNIATAGNAIQAADTISWSGIENYTLTGNGAQSLTLSDGNIAAGAALTVNGNSQTSTVFTFDGSAESDGTMTVMLRGSGNHIVTLGQGNDTVSTHSVTTGTLALTLTGGNNTVTTGEGVATVTLGGGNDNLTLNLGNDIVQGTNGQLDQNDTVAGGTGTDTIKYTDASTVRDSDFTNVTSVEAVTMVGDFAGTFTLGANASTAGITSLTLTDLDTADTVTVGAGFASNLTVNIAAAASALNTVNAAAYTKVLTIAANATSLDTTTSVLTGGTGTSDVLSLTGDLDTTIVTTSISGIENWTTSGTGGGAGDTLTMVSVDGNIAAGKSLTVDFTSADDDNLAANFANESDGTVTILADGSGAHIVTLGQGADTYTSTSTGVDTVVATKGANTISVGDGVDIITLGTGTDTITIGTAGDADVVKVVGATALVANTAVITDWTTSAAILLTFAIVDGSSRNLVALDDGADATSANSISTILTGAKDLGNAAIVDNSTHLALSTTTAISGSSAVETALEFGGTFQLTNEGAKAAGDTWFVSYDDNVSSYIAMVTVNSVVADGAYFGVGSLDAIEIIKLTGVADNSVIVAGDITFA
jgi:hypothetical protein